MIEMPTTTKASLVIHGRVFVFKPEHPRANKRGFVRRAIVVSEAHVGRFLNRQEVVHHKNRNKMDDQLGNLQIMTRANHSRLHNLEDDCPRRRLVGDDNAAAKLTATDVLAIRSHALHGMSLRGLSRLYGMSRKQVYNIVARVYWTHI